MNEGWIEDYEALPKAGSHRLIDFEEASVVTNRPPAFPPQFLSVSGRKPYANMWVDLAPLAHVGRPDYWSIEVVGRLPVGIGLPSEEAQYELSVPLYGLTGTEGIEIIGATRSERIEVPHEQTAGECSNWYAEWNFQPPSTPYLEVWAECTFPNARYKVVLRRREPQGINPKDLLLERIVTELEGGADEETTLGRLDFGYVEEIRDHDLVPETVTILPDAVTVPVYHIG
jgi:hypothetical protein